MNRSWMNSDWEDQVRNDWENQTLYDEQTVNFDEDLIREDKLLKLIGLIHKYRKGLEQEVMIG